MTYVTFLGKCANLTEDQNPVSFIIEDTKRFLVDAGPTVVQQLYKAKLGASDIDALVVTHCHGDHTLGFPYFAFSKFFEGLGGKGGPTQVPLIALESVYQGLQSMLEFCYPPGKYPNFEFVPHFALPDRDSEFIIGDTKITTFPVTHAVPNIGVRFDLSNGQRITYSSDTVLDDRVIRFAENSDLLIHEAFGTAEVRELGAKAKHGIAEEAGKVAQKSGSKSLAMVHLMPKFIGKESSLIDEAQKFFNGSISVPNDLEKIFLSRKSRPGETVSI